MPDESKISRVMRPSETLNEILGGLVSSLKLCKVNIKEASSF